MWRKIWAVVGGLVVLGGVVTGGWVLDDRYAKAGDVKSNKKQIRINGLKDNIRWYQDQMSYIMTRCGVRDPNKLPEHAYRNYKDYQLKKQELDKELNAVMQEN
jgi:hypothetical protein